MYEGWRHRIMSVSSIDLDPRNPRLSRRHHNLSQLQIARLLLGDADVDIRDIAESISKNGYFPDQVIVVVKSETSAGRFTAIEGNRRLCALRVLQKPDIARKSANYSSFKRYAAAAESNGTVPDKIRVTIAPSREATKRLVGNRHIKRSVKRWGQYEQGSYFTEEFRDGKTISEIAQDYGIEKDEIRRVTFAKTIIDVIKSLEWEEDHPINAISKEKMNHEAIRRLFVFSETQKLIGRLQVADDGAFKSDLTIGEFTKLLRILAEDANTRYQEGGKSPKLVLTSRSINDEALALRYVSDTLRYRPDRDAEGERFDSATFLSEYEKAILKLEADDADAEEEARERRPGSRPPPPRRDITLLPKDLQNNLSLDKLKDVIDEAQRLNRYSFKYAAAGLARTILETLIADRIKKAGLWDDFRRLYHNKYELECYLKFLQTEPRICDNEVLYRMVKAEADNIQKRTQLCINLALHNKYAPMSESDIDDIKDRLRPIVRAFVQDEPK